MPTLASTLSKSISRLPGVPLLNFLYVQRVKGFSVGDRPWFDSDASTEYFTEKLRGCRSYLEYGSGGSTYLAASLGKWLVTVDSDNFFLRAVKNKIVGSGLFNKEKQHFIHADIGLTKEWGRPVVVFPPSAERLTAFDKYSDFPRAFAEANAYPDLVLVDGRFRVACALKAFKALGQKTDWTLIVDDYVERPYYKVLENFAKLDRLVGRMAVFTGLKPGAEGELATAIGHYAYDYR